MKPIDQYLITNDADLHELWTDLMGPGGFGRRSLWLLFLDEGGTPLPLLVPIDDLPLAVEQDHLDSLEQLIGHLVDDQSAGSMAMLLSRPGPAAMTERDREWGAALTGVCARQRRSWPVFLATRDQVSVFAADDLVGLTA